MTLEELDKIASLGSKSNYEKIKIFGWWLHTHQSEPSFAGADIGRCYDGLHFAKPSSFSAYIHQLRLRKELLPAGKEYKLENKIREQIEAAYGTPETTIKVTNLLTSLTDTIPDLKERAYYKEALICYKSGSLRAAVVMTWNVAFSHLCDHVLAKRLSDFNAQWQQSHPNTHKNRVKTISTFDDFNDNLKEAEILAICRSANIISKNIFNIMEGCLKKRNAAAHPNEVIIGPTQADAFIADLIQNVVLQIS